MNDIPPWWIPSTWGLILYGLITLGFMTYVHFFVKKGDLDVEKDPEKVKTIVHENSNGNNVKWKKALGVEPIVETEEDIARKASVFYDEKY